MEFDIKPSEMAFLSNSRWQNRKERPNRSTNNGDMDEKAKRLVKESVISIYNRKDVPYS